MGTSSLLVKKMTSWFLEDFGNFDQSLYRGKRCASFITGNAFLFSIDFLSKLSLG